MASYTVSLNCKRSDAFEVLNQAGRIFGSVRMYVVDPLLLGKEEDFRKVTFDYASVHGDLDDPFDPGFEVSRAKLDEMVQRVREATPAITGHHVIDRSGS